MTEKRVQKLTVNAQLAMTDNLLDLTLLLQIVQGLASQTAIDFESIDECGHCD